MRVYFIFWCELDVSDSLSGFRVKNSEDARVIACAAKPCCPGALSGEANG